MIRGSSWGNGMYILDRNYFRWMVYISHLLIETSHLIECKVVVGFKM